MHRQLYWAVRGRIASGAAPAGAALPATRAFSAELGVSRATVVTAYDQLQSEGFIEGRPGSGVFVVDAPELAAPAAVTSAAEAGVVETREAPLRAFRPGAPDMRLFPHLRWARIAAAALRRPDAYALSSDLFGLPLFRRALSRHLAEWRGLTVSPEHIAVTAGASGALDLIFDAFTRPGDLVAMEDPGYPVVRAIAEQRALRIASIPVDDRGFRPDALRALSEPPRLAIVTPSNQFPLGAASPASRRAELLAWATEAGAIVVEDDYDSEFRFTGRPLPALASASGAAQVIYVGSLSKVFSPALRIGYLAAPAQLAPKLREALGRFGPRASLMPQRPLADFMESGEFGRHLRRMRRTYAARRQALLAILNQVFGEGVLIASPRDAGMHMTVAFGRALANLPDTEAARRAQAAGVVVEPLSKYYHAAPAQNGLLLGFAAFDEAEMREAADRLRTALLG